MDCFRVAGDPTAIRQRARWLRSSTENADSSTLADFRGPIRIDECLGDFASIEACHFREGAYRVIWGRAASQGATTDYLLSAASR
jgi:hypothetical protein